MTKLLAAAPHTLRIPLLALLLCCATALAGASFQHAELEPAADLDELIERSNDHSSFRAVFRLHSSDGREALMTWDYLSDDFAHVSMESDGELGDLVWFDDGVMTTYQNSRDGERYVLGMDVGTLMRRYEPVVDELDRRFPREGIAPFDVGLYFTLSFDKEEDVTDLSVGLHDRGLAMFSWLEGCLDREAEAQDDPALFVYDDEIGRLEISSVTGIPVRGWIGAGDDRRLAVELVEFELDVEFEESELTPPEWEETNEMLDRGFQRATNQMIAGNNRSLVYRRLAALEEDDELEWSDDALTEILHGLHVVAAQLPTASYMAVLERQLKDQAERLSIFADENRSEPDFPEGLLKLRNKIRGELQSVVEEIIDEQVNELTSPPETGAGAALEDRILEVERTALRSALEDTLLASALELFDQTIGAVE